MERSTATNSLSFLHRFQSDVVSLTSRRASALLCVFAVNATPPRRRVTQRSAEQYLKRKLHRELHLTRIAHARTQEAVKVEQPRRDKRVDVVRVVESIEHLDHRDDRVTLTEPERSLNAPVKREILVVLARGVAVRRGANAARSDRLSSSSDRKSTRLNSSHSQISYAVFC